MKILIFLLAFQLQEPAIDILNRISADLAKLRTAIEQVGVKNVVTVTNSVELQAALDGPAPTILVQPGTYTGNFTIKAKPTATTVVGLKFTGRATTGLGYPKLVAADPIKPVLNALDAAHDYTFIGLEFTGAAPDRDLIVMGRLDAIDAAMQPRNITFQQCYIHGVGSLGHRGISFNASNGTVRDSYLSEFVEIGRDSQAIFIGNGPGPFLIENNYIEASGENMMVGGVTPAIVGLIPAGIVVRDNTFSKSLAWKSSFKGSVKNLFELKNAQDVQILNNKFENIWVDSQSGNAIVFTPRGQSGKCPWCNVTNVLFRCNEINNAEGFAMNILGTDNAGPSGTAERISVEGNLFTNVAGGFLIGAGVRSLHIVNNFIKDVKSRFMGLYGAPMTDLVFTGNLTSTGNYGVIGDGAAPGIASLEKYAPGYVFTLNSIQKVLRNIVYPSGNNVGDVIFPEWACK